MIFKDTKLDGSYIIELERSEDSRGFFARTFCQKEFESHNLNVAIAQANLSYNKKKGTLRGLHMQLPPYQESKLVQCIRGSIYDVIVDMRQESATFKQWIGVELNAENYRMLYIPEGFAHGFITLMDDSEVLYHINQFYAPGYEKGFRWNDPALNIRWPIEPLIISEKDGKFPFIQ